MAVIIEKAETGAFVTNSGGLARRSFPKRQRSKGRKKRGRYALSMMVKLGLCALGCAAALLIKLYGDTDETKETLYASSANSGNSDEDDLDEMLGKLRFVELPGILEVFAPDGLMELPISGNVSSQADGELMTISVDKEQQVRASLEGSVKETGEDAEKGLYVCITSGKLELCCYGLKSISVEDGQPVGAADNIGTAPQGGSICITLKKDGRPVEPMEHFRTEGGV